MFISPVSHIDSNTIPLLAPHEEGEKNKRSGTEWEFVRTDASLLKATLGYCPGPNSLSQAGVGCSAPRLPHQFLLDLFPPTGSHISQQSWRQTPGTSTAAPILARFQPAFIPILFTPNSEPLIYKNPSWALSPWCLRALPTIWPLPFPYKFVLLYLLTYQSPKCLK